MKNLSIILLIVALFSSCKKDDNNPNNSNNNPDTTICPDGYTGSLCTTTWISLIEGKWDVNYTSSTGSANGYIYIEPTSTATIFEFDHFLDYYNNLECTFWSSDEFTFSRGELKQGKGKIINKNRIEGTFYGGSDPGTFTATR